MGPGAPRESVSERDELWHRKRTHKADPQTVVASDL